MDKIEELEQRIAKLEAIIAKQQELEEKQKVIWCSEFNIKY